MTIEDRLTQALADQAGAVANPPDRWAEIEATAARARRVAARRRTGWRAGGVAVAGLAAAVIAVVALPGLFHQGTRRVVTRPAGPPVTTVAPPATSTPATSPPTTGTPAAGTPTTAVSASGYLPLYPFGSLDDVSRWRASYVSGGQQPWHLDAGQTSLSFTAFLGYTNVDTVVGTRTDAAGAHVGVGFHNPNGQPVTVAVVHLVRFGTGADAPWEVVGTDDTLFTLTAPAYRAVVTSPLKVGGAITGVDENISVQVRQRSSAAPLGQACCLPAGGTEQPWSTTVAFRGATDGVVTVAAATGGHVAVVERFAVTGARTVSGPPTPGL